MSETLRNELAKMLEQTQSENLPPVQSAARDVVAEALDSQASPMLHESIRQLGVELWRRHPAYAGGTKPGTVKTTIRIPDDLHRRAKARAGLDGESLDAVIAKALEEKLAWTTITPEKLKPGDNVRDPDGLKIMSMDYDKPIVLSDDYQYEAADLDGWEVKR